MITTAHRMESLSRAYVQAVAAQAGLNYAVLAYDYGIDIVLREVEQVGSHYVDTGRALDVQLRSTTGAVVTETEVRYDLDVRTYDHLRDQRTPATRVLVLMVLPADEADWVAQTSDGLLVRSCAYWLVLRGQPAVENVATIRVSIPRSHVATVDGLAHLLAISLQRGGQ
jgi:hypothetical protein